MNSPKLFAVADVSVTLENLVLLESTRIIRNQTTWAEISFTLTNEYGLGIPEAQYPETNFNITAVYMNSSYNWNETEISSVVILQIDEIDIKLNSSLERNQILSVTAK